MVAWQQNRLADWTSVVRWLWLWPQHFAFRYFYYKVIPSVMQHHGGSWKPSDVLEEKVASIGSKNKRNSTFCLLHVGFLFGLFFEPRDGDVLPKRWLPWCKNLKSYLSPQKRAHFIYSHIQIRLWHSFLKEIQWRAEALNSLAENYMDCKDDASSVL
jgi:hypothetical protein